MADLQTTRSSLKALSAAQEDTIAAVATPAGTGGIGVIRISGRRAREIGGEICRRKLVERKATYSNFIDIQGRLIDQGIVLFFAAPSSFTGEDVVELQAHGGPVILQLLLTACFNLGARQAEPGEFSQRAFCNDKIDLVQAEAIADLIESSTDAAARSALRTLTGDFSKGVDGILKDLIELRAFIEAAIDFAEEEIDFLDRSNIDLKLSNILQGLNNLLQRANQGKMLRDGLHVSLLGAPNAGKSSLLNALCGDEAAIVTDIPGTTRDLIHHSTNVDGIPLHLTDTAGLRQSEDKIEQMGVERAIDQLKTADCVLYLIDLKNLFDNNIEAVEHIEKVQKELERQYKLEQEEFARFIWVFTKADLLQATSSLPKSESSVAISSKTAQGLEELLAKIKSINLSAIETEHSLGARTRHINALTQAKTHVENGSQQFAQSKAAELLAEDLRAAQRALNTITGEFVTDDLLGEIFSSFCIGK